MTLRPPVLFLGSEVALLVDSDRSGAQHTPIYAPRKDAQAWKQLLEALRAKPDQGFRLILDTAGVVLHPETLPTLGKTDRHALLTRRLTNTFPDTPLRWILPWSKTSALLVSMRPQGIHSQWLDDVRILNNPCLSVDLAPFLMAALVHRLVPTVRHGWTLILSFHHTHTSGGRQVILRDGLPVLTTLLPPPLTQSPALAMAALSLDMEATRAWLKRLGWTTDKPLRLVTLLPSTWHTASPALGFSAPMTHVFSPHEAACAVRATQIPDPHEACSDSVLSGIVGLDWQRRRFALGNTVDKS